MNPAIRTAETLKKYGTIFFFVLNTATVAIDNITAVNSAVD